MEYSAVVDPVHDTFWLGAVSRRRCMFPHSNRTTITKIIDLCYRNVCTW
jgi:hypothetical protein